MRLLLKELLPGKKFSVLGRMAAVLVSVVALIIVFRKLDLQALRGAFANMNPWWFAAAFLLFPLAFVLAGLRWHQMLRLAGCSVHALATLRLTFIGHFFSTLLFGPSGGDIPKAALYSRWYGYPMAEVWSSCFLDRLLGFGGLVSFGAFAFAVAAAAGSLSMLEGIRFTVPQNWLWVGLALGAAIVFLILLRRRKRPESFLARTVTAFLLNSRRFLTSPRLAFSGFALAFAVQAATCGIFASCLRAVSHQALPWAELLWTFPVIALIAAMPVTISGSGFREGAALVLLGFYGVPGADAVAASLLTLAIHLIWAGLGGLIWWWQARLVDKVQDGRHPARVSMLRD